jgi:DNA-binding MarR family transcriptional regulator
MDNPIFIARSRTCGPPVYPLHMSDSCDDNPLALLIALADRLRSVFEQAAADVGLTAAQAHALLRIEGPMRLNELAHQQGCDPSTTTSMVQRLERAGLLKRTVDPSDARARLVQPTAKGRMLRGRFLATIGDGSTVLDALSDAERSALAGLFIAKRTS